MSMPLKKTMLTADDIRNKKFLVVGLVRNCGRTIDSDLKKINQIFKRFNKLNWLVIESDSDDDTLQKLDIIKKKMENFEYLTLGCLRNDLKHRTQRIAFCRNKYLEQIESNVKYQTVEYVVVLDLDNINSKLSEEAILSCWEFCGWDVCTANQAGPYYDIWALRHPQWCPTDCAAQVRFLVGLGMNIRKAVKIAVHSKMIRIPRTRDWIEVDSAFGGIAIYRKDMLLKGRYQGLRDGSVPICEHVTLHKQLKTFGARIFINPQLINAGVTQHTQVLFFNRRIARKIKRWGYLLINKLK